MRKIYIVFMLSVFITSCYSPAENAAINLLKSKAKAPSTFKVLEIESKDYTWQTIPELIYYDTVFSNTISTNEHEYDLRLFYDKNTNSYTDRGILKGEQYDSITIIKNWSEMSKATWVNITYQANNSFNAPIKGYQSIIVRNGVARFLIDDVGFDWNKREVIWKEEKFETLQTY